MFGPIHKKDAAAFGIVKTPAMDTNQGLGKRVLAEAFATSGWHFSLSDTNCHLSIKNAEKQVIGHMYSDGVIKGVNSQEQNQGKSGALPWLLPKLPR